MTADELAKNISHEASNELTRALDRIKHCVGQLTDAQIWHRTQPSLNSIGNLILHLCGNVRQWIVAGIGGATDIRNRPAEFAERGPIRRHELINQLDAVINDAKSALNKLSAGELMRSRPIQGSDVTALAAIFNSVPHFRGHTQEIIHITRELLGDEYRFAWTPMTHEQGAPK